MATAGGGVVRVRLCAIAVPAAATCMSTVKKIKPKEERWQT